MISGFHPHPGPRIGGRNKTNSFPLPKVIHSGHFRGTETPAFVIIPYSEKPRVRLMADENTDMLQRIFAMQTELNDYVFSKNRLVDDHGGHLTMATIFTAVEAGAHKVN